MRLFFIIVFMAALSLSGYAQGDMGEESLKYLESLDKMFLPYKLDMTIDQLERHLQGPGSDLAWESMHIATEYGDSSVRYMWFYLNTVPMPTRLYNTLTPCINDGNAVFLFKNETLFEVSFRVFSCGDSPYLFDGFIHDIRAESIDSSIVLFHKPTAKGNIVISRGYGNDETWKYNIDYRSYDAPKNLHTNW